MFQGGMSSINLGIEVIGGKEDPHFPNDNAIIVANVHPDSCAYGKLK